MWAPMLCQSQPEIISKVSLQAAHVWSTCMLYKHVNGSTAKLESSTKTTH